MLLVTEAAEMMEVLLPKAWLHVPHILVGAKVHFTPQPLFTPSM